MSLDLADVVQIVVEETGAAPEEVIAFVERYDPCIVTPEEAAKQLDALPMIHRATEYGSVYLQRTKEVGKREAPTLLAEEALQLAEALRRFSDYDFDRYLYESSLRPVWFGAVSDIEEQAGMDVELVEAHTGSFVVEAEDELPEEVAQGFDLHRIWRTPDTETLK